MGVPKRLTEMQKRFAEYLVFNEGRTTGADAAIAAGYSEKRARVEASELQNPRLSPLVVQYKDQLEQERALKFGVSYEYHIAELARIKNIALKKNSFSAAVNAETNRGKAGGLYIDRKIIKHGKLEDMSEEELENKMKQILDDYAPILNVTPEKPLLDQKPLKTKKKKIKKESQSISASHSFKSTTVPSNKKTQSVSVKL